MRIFTLLFLLISLQSMGAVNRDRFYRVFETKSIAKVNEEITALDKESPSVFKDAFLGAMLMKKAQFLKTPKEKINVFKKGKMLLESAIKKQPNNAEFRFLRLAIQENCPKILKYNSNINDDAHYIQVNYNRLNSIAKKHIKKYALHSQALNLHP